MAKEPQHRYTTCAALIGAAAEALGLRRSPPLHRRKALLLVAAVLVAALVAVALAAVLAAGGHAKAMAAPLFARKDTVARIDPRTNKVVAVVAVGPSPVVAAAGGHSVWVYNQGDATVSEIDARTNRVRKSTPIRPWPADVSRYTGPVLAADPSGAWFVNGARDLPPGDPDHPLLTNVLPGGRGKREYRLDVTPTGVAASYGAVWVVGRAARDYELLRVDPATGRVTARTRFPASEPIDSVATGYGKVWVVGSTHATLYRIDATTVKQEGRLGLGSSRASRPEIMRRGGDIWIRLAGRTGISVDPSFLSIGVPGMGKPESGEDRGDLGALWWYSWESGSLFRQEFAGGHIRTIHVTQTPADADGPCLTSISIGSGSLWLTAAPSPDGGVTCPPG